MADYGFRLTRDTCGKYSTPETIDRSWKLDELRKAMKVRVQEEIDNQARNGVDAIAITDVEHDVVEVRDQEDNHLLVWYEIEEFEQR